MAASRYKKLDQREHVLHRPDTYVGSLASVVGDVWLSEHDTMIKRQAFVSPALLKIFDEILVNAADSYARDKSMTTLKVTMTDFSVTVFNDGASIPVDVHPTEKCYVPELIFGHLLAGENFDDSEERMGGGRNGYGAKLTNIFSEAFHVDIADGAHRYKQSWTHNMSKHTTPKITSCAKKPYVSITFEPDFGRFGNVAFDADHVALFRRRVHDTAAILGKDVKVIFATQFTGTPWFTAPSDNKRTVKTFAEYVKSFAIPGVVIGDSMAVARCPDDEFEHVSFVNGVWTPRGGTHVTAVVEAISRGVVDAALKKKTTIKPSTVKNFLFVFVNASVINPTFDTQSKEFLTSKIKIPMDDAFVKKAVALVLDSVISDAAVKASLVDERTLKKTDGSKRARIDGIPKLTDANWAGTYRGDKCTLILTEGDSAKSLAIAGLSVVGRDTYGVFPLRGKLLNVRDASTASIANNGEIAALKQILGLQTGRVYTDAKNLRYGHVMIMTDADTDGSHISGLVVNFFHTCFPSLLEIPGFFQSFITPVVRAKKHNVTLSFYSLPELDDWKSRTPHHHTWTLKFYKGLGTSTAAEARDYFSDLPKHVKTFVWTPESSEAVDKAFSKTRAADRREWISAFQTGHHLDNSIADVPIHDFVDKELVLFSRADLERSIPSVVDGLKPSQRKVMFAAFKRNLTSDIKVAQFGGYVAEHAAYHHGEMSLTSTIINMAQNFVGSNNVNWLVPSGQFGTRLMGGKDAASARYVFTRLSPETRRYFHPEDDAMLEYLDDDGMSIEPRWYVPVIPTILVNGSEGIGTGWSTSIPCYDPSDIAANVRRLIRGEDLVPMTPWYRGFKGSIEPRDDTSFTTRGLFTVSGKHVEVTELPIGMWTQDAKELLDALVTKGLVKDYKENHSDTSVRFDIELTRDVSHDEIVKLFKLETTIRTSNVHAFDAEGRIRKYESPEDIIREWFVVRKRTYVSRKARILKDLNAKSVIASNKSRFVRSVIARDLVVGGRSIDDIVADLDRANYDRRDETYAYLLDMKIQSLTAERARALDGEYETLARTLKEVSIRTPEDLWIDDLDALI